MRDYRKFYINGAWVDPAQSDLIDVIDPASEQVVGQVSAGSAEDVDKAVMAARAAFPAWSRTSREERIALLERVVEIYRRREPEMADAIREEMGAPAALAAGGQTKSGLSHLKAAIDVLKEFEFERQSGPTRIVKEPIGVCGLITPWNWPMNQIACKVAPALATGCTMVLKPSEVAPFSAYLFAEILDEAGVQAGVFNLVNGGAVAGAALSAHPEVDMVSFTGSTRAGVEVAKAAAPTVKRVSQELGGKSPFLILDSADVPKAVTAGVRHVLNNSGQSCNAPTRMIVPKERMDEVAALAGQVAGKTVVGDPQGEAHMGPVVSEVQWDRIQALIGQGIEEGATLVCGGLGRPEGLDTGFYVRPTVFADVTNDMTIARQEIFGPVLVIIGADDTDHAVAIANDTEYGLAAYAWGDDADLRDVAARLRAGRVSLNGAVADIMAPFGGYKMSGNGREWGEYGFDEYLEVKAISGAA